jgi:hypothetical protein
MAPSTLFLREDQGNKKIDNMEDDVDNKDKEDDDTSRLSGEDKDVEEGIHLLRMPSSPISTYFGQRMIDPRRPYRCPIATPELKP